MNYSQYFDKPLSQVIEDLHTLQQRVNYFYGQLLLPGSSKKEKDQLNLKINHLTLTFNAIKNRMNFLVQKEQVYGGRLGIVYVNTDLIPGLHFNDSNYLFIDEMINNELLTHPN